VETAYFVQALNRYKRVADLTLISSEDERLDGRTVRKFSLHFKVAGAPATGAAALREQDVPDPFRPPVSLRTATKK
jgi:hypothetical protein